VGDLRVLVDDLIFPEGLCWHEGELWFSDFGSRRVFSVTPAGERRERVYVPGQPSGIGFRPDGTALVVSMMDHLLLRLGDEGATIEADLSGACVGPANDMLVDAHGRTYFGAFGYDPAYEGTDALKPSALSMVSESGLLTAVADGLSFPNGMAITADGGTLVVAETFGSRLTAFTVADDGSLSDRRVFAELGERAPDGICMDVDGAVWAGCPFTEEFVHVADGGEVLGVVPTPGRWAVAPALGGEDGRTLFCATARTTLEEFHHGHSSGAIEVVEL
jgi:sugar lactone lactonase YvrE